MSISKLGTRLLCGAFALAMGACAPRAVVETPAAELGNGGVEAPPSPRVAVPEAPPSETEESTSGDQNHGHHEHPRGDVHDHAAHVRGSEDDGAADGGSDDRGAEYACPMHPDVRSDRPIACPRCGMKLEKR